MVGSLRRMVVVVCTATLSASTAHGETAADKVLITQVVKQQYELFGKRDAVGYGKLFTKDGTFISMPGLKIDGRRDITDANAKFFAFMNVDKTRMTYKPARIKFIGPNTAIVYSAWSGLWTSDDTHEQSGYLTMVLCKQAGEWKINSATNAANAMGAKDFDLVDYDPADPRWSGKAK
ncbi:SgcJ/EcaC family oxidoreductase (plasmid) [Polymorphobacter sp. PAMC 29334]|uniref:YybH family protein n=1 Tax=Polymorphobacter sp. PAMC 29334 TaxID=2862331 RepID=UPI001C765063|nr:SgcJ/EcaC family oxidoreductase [Polymorphobacter sp. PAMC 29334]QYE33373.1 SgcJ/EcaC family oxidoreductase [Polymorphobacter sp. PAMC 29334]